jgi:hypothetical protein
LNRLQQIASDCEAVNPARAWNFGAHASDKPDMNPLAAGFLNDSKARALHPAIARGRYGDSFAGLKLTSHDMRLPKG